MSAMMNLHTQSTRRPRGLLYATMLAVATASLTTARAATVQEMVRLQGRGESVLQGFGLVLGLPGTGDSGDDLVVARPLARLLELEGAAVQSFDELSSSRSVAIVMVKCVIPRDGARADDKFDVIISAINNPKSLAGGELFLTPLRGPYPGDPVYAIAEGSVVLEAATPTRGRVRGGARLTRDVLMPSVTVDGAVTLLVNPHFSGWTTSQLLASTINDHRVGLGRGRQTIATALDERSVRVRFPEEELADPASFLADILSIRFDPSLLDLPATVLVNERAGVIIVTGDVEISPVILSHGDLVVTTVSPPRQGTPGNPIIEQRRWSSLQTNGQDSGAAKLDDLLQAFKQLDVSIKDQIAILSELHATGRLHAEFVVE